MLNSFKVKFNECTIRLGDKTYTVLQPTYPFNNLYVGEIDKSSHIIFGDESDLIQLGKVFAYRSVNREDIIYIPSKKDTTDYLKERWGVYNSYDLVLLHHTNQFKRKKWKFIRSRLNGNNTIEKNFKVNDDLVDKAYQFSYKDNKDILKLESNYHTLFLVGSELVFYNIISDCNNIAKGGRELYHLYKGAHDHAHLEWYMNYKDRYNNRNNITIDYYDKELWLT